MQGDLRPQLAVVPPYKELLDVETEGLMPDAQVIDPRDPKVRAAMRTATKRVKTVSDDILQQLSVAMKEEAFRDHLRAMHPDAIAVATERKPPPIRQGKSKNTKPKIDAPANRKKNKAASKARRKKT